MHTHVVVISITTCFVECFMADARNCVDCPNYGGLLTCDPQTCDWKLLNGYWAGNVTDGGDVLVGLCPLGFCLHNVSSKFVLIPRSEILTLNNFLCNGTHRMGVLCGQCQPGYAPAINSGGYGSECVPCDAESSKVNWIYYLLAVYVPLFVVLLVIIVFNIRLTTGPVNSFILFAQVISTTIDINQQGAAPLNLVYGEGTTAFEKSYEVPFNYFNLNLFGNLLPPFCLVDNLNTLEAISLRYVEAFFPVLIIFVTVLLLRCQKCLKVSPALPTCLQRYRFGTSLEHAFASFVLLYYNRLCETTIYLLSPIALSNPALETVEQRAFFQGDYSFTDFDYAVRYKLPAYLITAFLLVLPIALLHYPTRWVERLVSKVSCLRKVYPTASIAILLDTFQGCFKDNRRYFAGLYLVLRLLLLFAYLMPLLMLTLLLQEIIFIIYIFLLAVLKPYKANHLNFLDIAIFTNMALINILSWYTVNQLQSDSISLMACIIIESILVYLPMVYLIAYLLWCITGRYHNDAKMKVTEWYRAARRCLCRKSRSQQMQSFESDALMACVR